MSAGKYELSLWTGFTTKWMCYWHF